jgi:DNA-binding beta-propeller fold protein YncE
LWVWLAAGCAESNLNFSNRDADDTGEYDPDAGGDAEPDPGEGDDDESEREDDFLAMAPSETDVYVFVANPARNNVTRIDVFNLDVRTTPVGSDPRVVRVTPDFSTAVVFNRGDDTVSVIDADTLDTVHLRVRDNFNQLLLSPDGAWAGTFHDRAAVRPDDPPADGLQSFNEVSLVRLADRTVHDIVVSYNPRDIQFSADGTLAVVVSDEELALVDLTARELIPRLIPIADAFDAPVAEEVVLSESGSYAYVRQFGSEDLLVVNLRDLSTTRLPVGENPTDLDLSPDGTSAVVVSRGSGQVWVYEADRPELPARVLDLPEALRAGSILFGRNSETAVLYSTALTTDRYAIWDTRTDEIRVHDLVKPVRAMALTPDGGGLLVLHPKENLPDTPTSDPFYNNWALTLASLDPNNHRQNAIKLPAEPIGFANADDGQNGYFIMKDERSLVQLSYRTLLYQQIGLKSVPVYVGVLPDLDPEDAVRPPAWASQEHELGRITFFHPDGGPDNGGGTETITGFELNSGIEE